MGTKIKEFVKCIRNKKCGTKWNFREHKCEYENASWCNLPNYKRCRDCMRLEDGRKCVV